MAFFGLFGKKKEEPELGLPKEEELRPELGLKEEVGLPGIEERPSMPAPTIAPAREPSFEVREMPTVPAPSITKPITAKDIELISAKLDAINAKLDNLNARIAHLEKIAAAEEEKASREW